jgi:hypothetical protein
MVKEFIASHDPRWSQALLQLPYDVYDLPEYVNFCGEYEKARPIAFYARDGNQCCLIPLLLRRLPPHLSAPDDWWDVSSPYGYSSALFCGEARFCSKAVEAFLEACRERNIISAFIRLNPLIPIPNEALTVSGVWMIHGRTVGVDLTLTDEEIRKQTRRNHRSNISRLLRLKFTTTVDDWSRYDDFITIYQETMHRVNADPYYRFGREYFSRLKTALCSRLHLVSVLAPDGRYAAGKLLTEVNGIVQCHLGGATNAYRSVAPAKLAVDAGISWAKKRGNRVFHLGGGVGGTEDELFHFKRGFSSYTLPFETWRIITDRERYSSLLGSTHCTTFKSPSFFPTYRVVF